MSEPIKKAFTSHSSLKPYKKYVDQVSLFSTYRWGNWDSEIFMALHSVAKLLNWWARIQVRPWNSHSVFLLLHSFNKYLMGDSVSGLNTRESPKLSGLSDKI